MINLKHLFIFLIVFLFYPPALQAETVYGLAMHGAPKYGPDFTHLDYANPDAAKGGVLKQAASGTFDTLNPYALKGQAAKGLNLVYDRLMGRVWDEPFTLYPLIAEKVDIPDDRSSVTFTINQSARFNDGSPITADDVLFSFETLKEKGRPNMRRIYKLVRKAEKLDSHTVHFEFGEGYDRETVMILAIMPVLSKAWWENRNFDETILDIPVSNGPYSIALVDPGRRIIYERNPDYWAKDLPINVGHYNFEQVIYDYYRDDSVAFEAFKAGDLNLRREWDGAKWASAYDFPSVKNGDIFTSAIRHQRPEKVKSLIFNTRREPFNDRIVRKALVHALDFSWINQNLLHGQYQQVDSYFPNSTLAARGLPSKAEMDILGPWRGTFSNDVFGPAWEKPDSSDRRAVRANLRLADQLLRKAGWVVQGGTRVKKDDPSQRFTFEILLSAAEEEKIALSFKQQLQKLGIDVRIRVLDSAAFTGRLTNYDYDMVLYHWQNSLSPGTEQMLYWSCNAAKTPSQWNFSGICSPAVDKISSEIANAKDRISLVQHVHALDRILMHGYYMIPLHFTGQDFFAHSADILRPERTPLYGAVTETWWMAK